MLRRTLLAQLIGTGILVSALPANAQFVPGTPYQMTRSTIQYQSLQNPTILTTSASSGQFAVTLPFPMSFYDTTIQSLSVGVNGAIAFPSGTFVSTSNQIPGTASFPAGFIAPHWENLWLRTGQPGRMQSLGWEVQGVTPNRTVTIEWRDIDNFSTLGSIVSFQVRFHEGPAGRIEIDYGPATGTGFFTATHGMEDTNNARPILFEASGCTNNCTTTDFISNSRVTLVQDPGVELYAVGVTPPQFGYLGAITPIPVTVQNLHSNPLGPFQVEVWASQSPDGTNQVPMGTAMMFLGGFEAQTISVDAIPPVALGEGTVYVGLTVDSTGVITEVDEMNNVAVSTEQIRMLTGLADLTFSSVTTPATMVTAGDSFDVDITIENVGGMTATDIPISVYLSTNSVISPQDLELDTFNVTLDPNESTTVTRTVTTDGQTNSGAYYVGAFADAAATLDELSESNNGLAADNTITISGAALAIANNSLPFAVFRVPYASTLTAIGGDPNDRDWTVVQGDLPDGLGLLRRTGEIFGRPTMVETQTFTVQVASGNETATKELTLSVTDPTEPLTIVTNQLAVGRVGQEYAFPIIVTGGALTSSVSWAATGLPDGFVLTEQGVLGGTPTAASTSTVTITASSGGETASRDLILEVVDNPNLLIVPRTLAKAQFDQPYTEQLESTGGVAPIVWVVRSGDMPPGLTLSTEGQISGTPMSAGEFRFVVEIRDSNVGSPQRDANTFVIDVEDDGTLTIATERLEDGVVGLGFDAQIEASGGLPPYTWEIDTGRIPPGLVAQQTQMSEFFAIRGQPSEAGTWNLLVEVTDSQGRYAVRAFSLRVLAEAPVVVDPTDEEGGCSCNATERSPSGLWLGALMLVGLLIRRRR